MSLRHLVLLRFNPDTAEAEIRRIEAAFVALQHRIDGMRAIEWGRNQSPEGLDQGYTHAFLIDFDHAADRDAYLPHPAHQAFVAEMKPSLADVLVIDYTPQSAA